eukprot:5596255-Alexandrium_andersonii.AAC.1
MITTSIPETSGRALCGMSSRAWRVDVLSEPMRIHASLVISPLLTLLRGSDVQRWMRPKVRP